MGQKVNPNLFNFKNSVKKQSRFLEKKHSDHSIFLKTDLELKIHTQNFFVNYNITINNCKLIHFNNLLYIYISYKYIIKNNLLKHNKIQIIKNSFNTKKVGIQKLNYIKKKKFSQNWPLVNKNNYYKKVSIKLIEINSFINFFFSSLLYFKPKKFNVFLVLEKQNKKLVILKKKQIVLKKKQKLTILRKYNQNKFFKEGINILVTSIAIKNPSKLLACFIATQIKTLKFHNFFIRFIKNTLTLLNNKVFFSTIRGIKINIKGRFNGNSRAENRSIWVSNLPPLLAQKSNIDYFKKISYTINGTFGIKLWVYQY